MSYYFISNFETSEGKQTFERKTNFRKLLEIDIFDVLLWLRYCFEFDTNSSGDILARKIFGYSLLPGLIFVNRSIMMFVFL